MDDVIDDDDDDEDEVGCGDLSRMLDAITPMSMTAKDGKSDLTV